MNSYPMIAQTSTVPTPGIRKETPEERILSLNGLRGDPTKTLEQLQEESDKNRNWRDDINYIFRTDAESNPKAIDWKTRKFDGDGRVQVNAFDRLIGRSQEELQAAWEKFRREQLKKEFGGKYLAETGEILKPNELSNADTVRQEIEAGKQRRADVKPLIAQVSSMSGFKPEMLPERPSVQQINQLISDLEPEQQENKDAAALLQSQLETEASSRQTAESLRQLNTIQGDVAQQTAQTARDRLGLEQQVAEINAAIARNNQASSDYNAAEDRRLREQQNQMTMQLAIMKQEDNRADRTERREDRRYENRQAAIIALIQGLARLGQGFQL